ncbi:MAG TPA: hypothetical protein DCF68_03405, partial [Cyanothece sp. UBA12306]|nr:hypothetical protein [Cyanothece sp. UBA12306]
MSITNFLEKNPDILTKLENNYLEFPGTIQEQGILLVLQEPELIILQASENIFKIWGLGATELINQHISKFLSQSELETLQKQINQENIEDYNPIQ